MFIIWRGFGWLIPVIIIASFLLTQLSVDALLGEGAYQSSVWPKVVAILIASALIAALGYWFNYKRRRIIVDATSGSERRAPSDSLFFIPIEVWALIVPVLLLWGVYNDAQSDAKEMLLIQSPAVNDKYAVDYSELFTEFDDSYKYGVLMVVAVESSGVQVVASEVAYDRKSGVRTELREGHTKGRDDYAQEEIFLSAQDLVDLKNSDAIFQVTRD